ncbi:hypothetical protein EDB86DRAFT_2835187 [Lactarius hatsudake]|nr:hypothetical protein EDB86DRAFT_2835187 [Lactarius hatsudake]
MKAVSLLRDLEEAIKRIPSDTPSATPEHPLSAFAIDPHTCFAEPGEDDWMIINQMMKSSFGWGEREMKATVPHLLNQGPYGLDGFIHFLRFFVQERGLQGALFETKIDAVVKEIKDRLQTTHAHEGSYPSEASTSTQTAAIMAAPTRVQNLTKNQDVIDVDEIEDVVREVEPRAEHKGKQKVGWPCKGILVTFPEGTTHHQSYPFGMHSERPMPWNYRSTDDVFYLQAKSCQKMSFTEGRACENCRKLTSSTLFSGIMDRIQYGTHENVPFMYHGVGGLIAIARRKTDQIEQLHMSKLNDSRKLLTKQYKCAAEKLYKPKGYTNEDIMRSIVLLRLGGVRVAQFAHQLLALPSLTTIRRQTVLPALVVSPSAPTVVEVEANIISCYLSLNSVVGAFSGGTAPWTALDLGLRLESDKIVHQVLMLDELAIEKRVRWDNLHNKFQGTCREHNHRIPLDFTSERELDILCEAIGNDEIHLATEVHILYLM